MNARSPRPRGVVAPVFTPFSTDLSPVAPRFIRHCKSLPGQGAGFVVFGAASEANSLAVNEKRALLDALLGPGLPPQ
jgi:4-hydroxy-tetrahydrodipicolinate synthase